jgi:hypothetical protein
VGTTPTGAWAGQSNNIATFQESNWIFITAFEGMRSYDQDQNEAIIFNGTSWDVYLLGFLRTELLRIQEALANDGTPVFGSQAFTNFSLDYWEFDSTTQESITIQFSLPQQFESTPDIDIRIYYASQGTETGKVVRFDTDLYVIDDTDNFDSPGATFSSSTDTPSTDFTADELVLHDVNLTITPASVDPDKFYVLNVGRDASHANDTLNSAIRAFLVVLQYKETSKDFT